MSKRNAILAAATRLFSRNGFKGTAMAELSTITGAADRTIFHHFKNKEDLFLYVLKDVKKASWSSLTGISGSAECRNGLEMVEGVVAFI
jgi:TetR/AcrR family fatty acid metabolism transcriptional regulator